MKKYARASLAALFVLAAAAGLTAQESTIQTVQDIQKILPRWGTAWTPGNGSENGYYRTFYVGYAMRQESPERIHIRLGRGNNTRVSVILDQQTISDYLFDLKTRSQFYDAVTKTGDVNVNPSGGKFLPQLDYFQQIVASPVYDILPTVEKASAGQLTEQELYIKSLETLKALNPGRVFDIRLNLAAEFAKWKSEMQGKSGSSVAGDAKETILALDSLVWGRVNYASKPSSELLDILASTVDAANGSDNEAFVASALKLFKAATGSKYDLKIVDNGQWVDAIQCSSASSCTLNYPEFTAIYPTGSVKSKTTDQFGNKIAAMATPGLWQFLKRSDGVDHIRKEPYYGWIPKMDYQAAGNGFHNPAVRNGSFSKHGHEVLGIPSEHKTLWAVLRGPVSHGCSRLPVGHVLEMRFIMPVSSEKMVKINHFGNNPKDFDIYDINGDGNLEVMGVKYAIAYDFQDREASSLEIGHDAEGMAAFHKNLYGAKNVYSIAADGTLIFHNPQASLPSYLDFQKTQVSVRPTFTGDYPLYEQEYEQDKIQYYSKVSNSVAQLMGKVRGCAPSRDASECGQDDFRAAAKKVIGFTDWN